MLGSFCLDGRSSASTVLMDLGVDLDSFAGILIVRSAFGGDGDGFACGGNIYDTTLLLFDFFEGVFS